MNKPERKPPVRPMYIWEDVEDYYWSIHEKGMIGPNGEDFWSWLCNNVDVRNTSSFFIWREYFDDGVDYVKDVTPWIKETANWLIDNFADDDEEDVATFWTEW